MGFLKWIKRELDAPGSCKRRQSEPPLTFGCLDSNSSRDDSYLKAIFKFNEWRRSQQTKSPRYLAGRSYKRQKNRAYTKVERRRTGNGEDNSNPTALNDTCSNGHGVYEEIRMDGNNEYVDLDNSSKKDHDSSLKQKSKINRRKQKRRTMYENEIVEPSQTESPPTNFYRENSNPFGELPSPNKCPIHDHSLPRSPKEDRSSNQKNSDYSSRLKKDCNQNVPNLLLNHNEDTNDGSRNPLAYQKITNIRGEEVEYALPYSEKNLMESQTTIELDEEEGNSIYDNVPDEIRTNQEQSPENSALSHSLTGQSRKKSPVIVTDLDNSNGPTESLKGDIFRELNSLEKWSKNISLYDEDNKSARNSISDSLSKSSVIVCRDMEISEKNIPSKGSQTTPVFIRPGKFRRAAVTKYFIKHPENYVVEKGLHQNFLIMRKIRHPNISLLMATVCDIKKKFKSLILEPFSCSLNNLIYESGIELPVKDCLDYTTQITKAIVYLHANGFIHSDISNSNIFICQHNKQAKLSSFQLTTYCKSRIHKEILSLYGSGSVPDITEIPIQHLPYLIEYRKIFSKHHYQAPELITSQNKFVFPCKQSDVYGITICLWEMLNQRVPFALFSYNELEKIYYLKQAQLPNFEAKRCKHLHRLLKEGLRINPDERVQTAEELCRLLQDINTNFDVDDIITKDKQKNFNKALGLPQNNVCTSTLKQKKGLSNCPLIKTTPFVDEVNQNCTDTGENNLNTKNVSTKEYLFEIDHISLPDTPIARQNKIRRTAWLTNKTVSSVNSSPRGEVGSNRETTDTPPSAKKYNINITIMHSDAADDNALASPKPPIKSQIEYWNSLTSPSVNPKKQDGDDFDKSPKIEQTSPKNKKESGRKTFPLEVNSYPSMPEMLNESFTKKDRTTDEDFEKFFWKREKERCEKSSPSTPRRTSVKETVHKFEQISSGASITSPLPKTTSSKSRDKDGNPFRLFLDGLQDIRRSLEKRCRSEEKQNQISYKDEAISTCAIESSPNSSFNEHSQPEVGNLSDQYSIKVIPSEIENQKNEEIISKLNVVLSNNLKNCRKTRSNPELNKIETVNARMKRNAKKLYRRRSDVGCVAQRIIQTTREFKTANDSMGGTELREITLFSEININSPQLCFYRDLFLKNSQLHREISCRDCGSHNVHLGDTLRRHLQFQNSQILNSSMDVSHVRNSISTVNESLEDLYIDDDLNHGPKLAPNMKLTKPELSLFSALNFGALNFNTSSISSDLKLSDESLISKEDNGHN